MSREQNRRLFPFAAQMVDELRAEFPDAKITWASENGKQIGKQETGFIAIQPYKTKKELMK